jgi:pyruvate dehydrogenase E1 component
MQAKAKLEEQIKTETPSTVADIDPQETSEWLEAWDQILNEENPQRASYLLNALTQRARAAGLNLPPRFNTPYINTIRPEDDVPYPGNLPLERKIKSAIRWNALAMVVQQNKKDAGIGGHISTFASAATLLEVGFNHFFRGSIGDQPGEFIYFQGHASPGIYAALFWKAA